MFNNKYIIFVELENEELINHTNNYIERFHHILNIELMHFIVNYLI